MNAARPAEFVTALLLLLFSSLKFVDLYRQLLVLGLHLKQLYGALGEALHLIRKQLNFALQFCEFISHVEQF
jgi:hypothetical protein